MTSAVPSPEPLLAGQRVLLIGKLASMNQREAADLVRQHGGEVATRFDERVSLIVMAEANDAGSASLLQQLPPPLRNAVQRGQAELVGESQFWQQLGLVEPERDICRLYTPAMMADLCGIPVAKIRNWHRGGLLVPVREVRRLPYFDFEEVNAARRLAELTQAGISTTRLLGYVALLKKRFPQLSRPLAELSLVVQGKQLLLREGDDLLQLDGQKRFDFDAPEFESDSTEQEDTQPQQSTANDWAIQAAKLEEQGQSAAAAEAYRAALAAEGPTPELCFLLAEILYDLGDKSAARERYAMAIELNADYVEAHNNLGCVLAELGQPQAAIRSFEAALSYLPDYLDARYHLASLYDELGQSASAEPHWRTFLELAPESPWADYARSRLSAADQ